MASCQRLWPVSGCSASGLAGSMAITCSRLMADHVRARARAAQYGPASDPVPGRREETGAGGLHAEATPLEPTPQAADAAVRAALDAPAVREELDGAEHRVLSVRPLIDDREEEPTAVRATVYDYTNERTLLVDAPLDGARMPSAASSGRQPVPSEDERRAALAVLERDPELGPALREGRLTPYRPMPPVLTEQEPDGRVLRAVTVGLHPADGDDGHEIVAVRLVGGGGGVPFPRRPPPRRPRSAGDLRPAWGRPADGERRARQCAGDGQPR